MSEQSLLPCPFCGGEAEFERIGNRRQSTIVSCTSCAAMLESNEEWDHGRLWNARAALPSEPVAVAMDGSDNAPQGIQPSYTPLPEFYPLALKPAQNSQVDDCEHWVIDADGGHVFCICGSRERAEGIVTVLNAAASPSAQELPADVRRLVVAARTVAFEDQGPDAMKALDLASEAFADRVRWDEESIAQPARSAASAASPPPSNEALVKALGEARADILYLKNARGSEAEGSDADWVGYIDAALKAGGRANG